MKKFSIFLPIFLASFFLLLPNVKADIITIDITDDMFSKLSNIDTYIATADSTCQQNATFCNYFIRYQNDFSYSDMYLLLLKGSSYPKSYLESGRLRANNNSQKYVFDSPTFLNTTSSYYNSSDWQIFQYDNGNIRLLLYSSFDIPFKSIDNNTYVFTYNNETWSILNDGSNSCPTLYDLNEHFNGELPVPPDNTPVLTSFYSVVGSKIAWLGEQIVSNYIYLSIIGVFILIFLIELIRRYFL